MKQIEKAVITEPIKKSIEKILAKGNRAEIIPGPNGTVKVICISRKVEIDTSKTSG